MAPTTDLNSTPMRCGTVTRSQRQTPFDRAGPPVEDIIHRIVQGKHFVANPSTQLKRSPRFSRRSYWRNAKGVGDNGYRHTQCSVTPCRPNLSKWHAGQTGLNSELDPLSVAGHGL